MDLIRGFESALAALERLHSHIFLWLFSLRQSTSQLQAAAGAGSQECISAAEQKLLRNQTSNKFIFKARDLGNWNYLGGISFNGNHRITSFLAENALGCDEMLMCAQGLQSYQISNSFSAEKMLSIIAFQTCEGGKKNQAKKTYYLRKVLSSSKTQEGMLSH